MSILRQTVLSPDRKYRYALWRQWGWGDGFVVFIGLNPSTADELTDDPTIRRCVGFAKRWGFGALCMANLFAFRATDPKAMMAQDDPVGPDNDLWLRQLSNEASLVVAAWGVGGSHMQRGRVVLEQVGGAMECLGRTKGGQPRHPLYVRGDAERVGYA